MKIESEISELELTNTIIISSALLHEQYNNKDGYIAAARQSIVELHKNFVLDHHRYSDKDFLILKRLLGKLDRYDDIESLTEYKDYEKRCHRLNYKTLDMFDSKGMLNYSEEAV